MPRVQIPALLRELTNGQDMVVVPGETVGQVIENLDQSFPGIKGRLCYGNKLRKNLSLVIDGKLNQRGITQTVSEKSVIRFIPAISGG